MPVKYNISYEYYLAVRIMEYKNENNVPELKYVGNKKIPAGVSGFFIVIKSFRLHYGPRIDPVSNRNEYQEYFLVVKAAGA